MVLGTEITSYLENLGYLTQCLAQFAYLPYFRFCNSRLKLPLGVSNASCWMVAVPDDGKWTYTKALKVQETKARGYTCEASPATEPRLHFADVMNILDFMKLTFTSSVTSCSCQYVLVEEGQRCGSLQEG